MNEGYDPARFSVEGLLPITPYFNPRLLYGESEQLSRVMGVFAPYRPEVKFTYSSTLNSLELILGLARCE